MTSVLPYSYTQRNIFEILINQSGIRFGTKRKSVWFQINRKMLNTIWFQIDLIRFRKDFSVCIHETFFWLHNLPDPNIQFLIHLIIWPVAQNIICTHGRRLMTVGINHIVKHSEHWGRGRFEGGSYHQRVKALMNWN